MTKRTICLIITLSIMLSAVLFFSACTPDVDTFAAFLDGDTLAWQPVSGADYYSIRCTFPDGSGYSARIKGNSFAASQLSVGDYVYVVTAKSSSNKTIAKSKPIIYHLGKGSKSDPIAIRSKTDLEKITTGTFSVTYGSNTVSAPCYYYLANDIDLNGEEWTPLSINSFSGVFDGCGHAIKNYKISKTTAGGYAGLFARCSGAIIKNLKIEGFNVSIGGSVTLKEQQVIGGLAGNISSSTIDNCSVNGSIDIYHTTIKTGDKSMYVGGLVGQSESSLITNCVAEGTYYASYSRVRLGGLVGNLTGSTTGSGIANCYTNVNVTARGTDYDATTGNSTAHAYAGTLVGYSVSAKRVASSFATGTADAITSHDGAQAIYIGKGVFGGTAGSDSTSVSSAPVYNVYYDSDKLGTTKAIGNRQSVGTGKSLTGLTTEEIKNKNSFNGFDFDNIWSITENGPTLKSTSQIAPPEMDLTIIVIAGTSKTTYSCNLTDTFLPTAVSMTIDGKSTMFYSYSINTILSNMGFGDTKTIATVEYHRTKMIVNGKNYSSTIEKSGASSFPYCYLVYATNENIEEKQTAVNGYKLVNSSGATLDTKVMPNDVTITIYYE